MPRIVVSLVTAASLALAACGGQISSTDDSTVEPQALRGTCTALQYETASSAFDRAIAGAKARLSDGACADELSMQDAIADAAARATAICGDFRETIRSSAGAAPLREALANTLSLRAITGELSARDGSPADDWSGVDALLPGTAFWARAQGAYGWAVRVELGSQGKATYTYLVDTGTDIATVEVDGTYAVEQLTTRVAGPRAVHVTHEGVTNDYVLEVSVGDEGGAPVYRLRPAVGDDKVPTLYSLVGECDA